MSERDDIGARSDAFKWYEGAWAAPVSHYTDRLVLLALAKHADKSGSCFPSRETIAVECVASVRAVSDALGRLKEANLITQKRRVGKSASYQLRMCGIRTFESAKSAPQKGKKRTSNVRETHLECAASAHKLSNELSNELSRDSLTRENGDQIEHIVEHWNGIAGRFNLPIVTDRAKQCRKACNARINDAGMEAVMDAIDRVSASQFLRGDVGNWNGASFDWLMKPANFEKVANGNYSDRAKPSAQRGQVSDGLMDAAMRKARNDELRQPSNSETPHGRGAQVLPFDRAQSLKG